MPKNEKANIIDIYKIKPNDYFSLYCVEGYEFVEDIQGNLHQVFEKVTYTVTGVGSIPVQVPKACKEQK